MGYYFLEAKKGAAFTELVESEGVLVSTIGNIIWIIMGGLLAAIYWCMVGAIFYVTIIGIPLGRQAFKMAQLTLAPFGKTIVYGGGAPSLIANFFWLVIGIPIAIIYAMLGAVCCITVIGIPVGLQLFKIAKLSLLPFGSSVV